MKNIALMFIFLFPIISCAKAELVGYWSVKCGGFGGSVEIIKPDIAKININDNNLFVSAHLEEGINGLTEVFYSDVIESMNEEISWGEISKRKPIAEILVRNGILHLAWKGFFDVKDNHYVWKKEPDFVVASKGKVHIEMKKCNFE